MKNHFYSFFLWISSCLTKRKSSTKPTFCFLFPNIRKNKPLELVEWVRKMRKVQSATKKNHKHRTEKHQKTLSPPTTLISLWKSHQRSGWILPVNMICEDRTGQGDRSRIFNCPPFLMQHLFPGMRNSQSQQESDEEVPQMGQLVNFLFTVHDLKREHAPNNHILPSLERISLSIYMGHKSEETEKTVCWKSVFPVQFRGRAATFRGSFILFWNRYRRERYSTLLFRSVFVSDVNMDEPLPWVFLWEDWVRKKQFLLIANIKEKSFNCLTWFWCAVRVTLITEDLAVRL